MEFTELKNAGESLESKYLYISKTFIFFFEIGFLLGNKLFINYSDKLMLSCIGLQGLPISIC